jgi:hypothetical protein
LSCAYCVATCEKEVAAALLDRVAIGDGVTSRHNYVSTPPAVAGANIDLNIASLATTSIARKQENVARTAAVKARS